MSSKCNICKNASNDAVNLRCDHHPCYLCIQNYVTIDPLSKLETKYQVICPTCNKKTVFYDLRHLITAKAQHEDQEPFVTDRYLATMGQPNLKRNTKAEINNFVHPETSQPLSRRGSIQSIANSKMLMDLRCLQHNQIYKYFCPDCCDNGSKRCLLCTHCAKPHQGHRLLSIKQGEARLLNLNIRTKDNITVKKGQISYMAQMMSQNRTLVEDHYCKLEENLNKEYNNLIEAINQKYEMMRLRLKQMYEVCMKDIEQKTERLGSHQSILQTLQDIELKDLETNMKFYQTYQKYTATNQIVQLSLEINPLPIIITRPQLLLQIEEWISIQIEKKVSNTNYRKAKKNSMDQIGKLSSRNHKENRKPGVDMQLSFRKIMG